MPNIIEISSFHAPELDVYARLTEAQLRNRQNPSQGMFIAESPKVIEYALNAGYTPVSMLMDRKHVQGSARALIERCEGIPVYTADDALLANLTGFALTRSVLCAMRRPVLPDLDIICKGVRRIAVLENIVDPTNVGAIFRSAAALGMDAMLLSPACCDPLHRRAARVSMGAVFQIPWTRIDSPWPKPGMKRLQALGFKTAALALTELSIPIDDPALMAEESLALLLGTEGDGLSPETIAASDYTVLIPMSHGMNSLNVAAASAVAFWQLGIHK